MLGSQLSALDVIDQLRRGGDVAPQDLVALAGQPDLLEVQGGALLCLLDASPDVSSDARQALRQRWPALIPLQPENGHGSSDLADLCARLRRRSAIGRTLWARFVHGVVDGSHPPAGVAYVLMLIALKALSVDETILLAECLRDSGTIFDYRSEVRPRRLLRRYPTGAVSEKAALILPAVMAALSESFPLASNFLVARSLGFTGGTWDKLSSIPGFTFPPAGDETLALLKKRHVAMCVAGPTVAPGDRALYQIRSWSGTIEDDSLIAASISSKQAALPCDFLVLDVRYGAGAFLRTESDGHRVAELIQSILRHWDLSVGALCTEASWPGGLAIGNAIEVAEAIGVMDSRARPDWDAEAREAQWNLAMRFLWAMIEGEWGTDVGGRAVRLAGRLREEGAVIDSFERLLVDHGVAPNLARRVIADPRAELLGRTKVVEIRAPRNGTLRDIDQRRLGGIVNFVLGGGGNEYGGLRNLRAGCILRVKKNAAVRKGDVLLQVVGCRPGEVPSDALADCFLL